MQFFLGQIADVDVLVHLNVDLFRGGHPQHVNKLLGRCQTGAPVCLLEVFERSILPHHRLADLDPALTGPLFLSSPRVFVAVLPRDGAVMLLGEILGLLDLNNLLVVENLAPGGAEPIANRAEHPHHRHVELLGYPLGGGGAGLGYLVVESLLLAGHRALHERLRDAHCLALRDAPRRELLPRLRRILLVLRPNRLLHLRGQDDLRQSLLYFFFGRGHGFFLLGIVLSFPHVAVVVASLVEFHRSAVLFAVHALKIGACAAD